MKAVLHIAIATLFGGVAGVGGAAFFSQGDQGSQPAPGGAVKSSASPQLERGESEELEGRLARLERELRRWQKRGDGVRDLEFPSQEVSARSETPDADDEAENLDPADQIARGEGFWKSRLSSFDEESVDSARADAMSRGIRTDYQSFIDGNGGEVRELDCRTHLCKMEVQWDSDDGMRNGSSQALHELTPMSHACVRTVRQWPETLRTTVLFTCGDKLPLD